LASGQRFSQGSGTAGATVETGGPERGCGCFVLEDSLFRCLVIDGGVWSGVRRTGEVGSERVDGPKVLLEGVPLKAATRKEEGKGRQGVAKNIEKLKVVFNNGDQGARQGVRVTGWFFRGWELQRPPNRRSRRQGRWRTRRRGDRTQGS